MATEARLDWSSLGIRPADLVQAERMAESLSRGGSERRRAFWATMGPMVLAGLFSGLLAFVLAAAG